MVSRTLQGFLKHGCGEAIVARDVQILRLLLLIEIDISFTHTGQQTQIKLQDQMKTPLNKYTLYR